MRLVAVRGRTPLSLDVPAIDLAGADGLAFSLQHDPPVAGPVVTDVHMGHSFRMDGNVTALD